MIEAVGKRIGWADLPAKVRLFVEDVLGGPVAEATSQRGGFSPGCADRVRTTSGRRAFVKAVSSALNPLSLRLYRDEVRITGALPPTALAPRLLGGYDDGTWVAAIFEDVEGRMPTTPWLAEDLETALATLADLAEALTPCPVDDVPLAPAAFADDFDGWENLRARPWPSLDPWARAHLDDLCALADRGLLITSGDTLVHADIRADNLLIRPDGTVVIVDWPWARRGAGWLDTLLLLVNVETYGGHDVDRLIDRWLPSLPPGDITAFLAGLTGFFLDHARLPAPAGLPTVRAFQLAQGDAVLAWLRRRIDDGSGDQVALRERRQVRSAYDLGPLAAP